MQFSVDSFITDALSEVDRVIGSFTHTVFNNLVNNNQTVITLCFTFYIMFLGYKFMTHTLSADIMTITRRIVVMLVVYALIMNLELFDMFLYKIFTQEPTEIAKVIVSGGGAQDVGNALNDVYAHGMKTVKMFMGTANWHNIRPILYAIAVWIVTFATCIYALMLLIFAKMAMAIILALAPLFLIFILYDSTRGLFDSWLRQLINFGLVPIVTSAILALMLSIITRTLPDPTKPLDMQDFLTLIPFMSLSLTMLLLLSKVFHICSSLSHGFALSNFSKGIRDTYDSMTRKRHSSNDGGDGGGNSASNAIRDKRQQKTESAREKRIEA